MKTVISAIIFCLCLTVNAQTNQVNSNVLLGTWTFLDDETEKKDDCFTTHRFVFQQDKKCSYWQDIGMISTGKVNYHRLIFEGVFDYQHEKNEIVVCINGDTQSVLKMIIIKLSNRDLCISDEEGNQMNLHKNDE